MYLAYYLSKGLKFYYTGTGWLNDSNLAVPVSYNKLTNLRNENFRHIFSDIAPSLELVTNDN